MDGGLHALQNLTTDRRPWLIQVRALRFWTQPPYSKDLGLGDCMEIVFVDRTVCIPIVYAFIVFNTILSLPIHGN